MQSQKVRIRKLIGYKDSWVNKGVDAQRKLYRQKEVFSQRLGENKTNIPVSQIQLGQIIGRLPKFLRPGKTVVQDCRPTA